MVRKRERSRSKSAASKPRSNSAKASRGNGAPPEVSLTSAAEHDCIEADLLSDEALRKILSLLNSRHRVDLSQYKLTTIKRRIERRMALSHLDDLNRYAEHLRKRPEALQELHDDLFIHVTRFFRDPESFEALKQRVFPALLKAHRDETPIRVWVPGCSTGEEAYSLAIAFTEFLEAQHSNARVQIFATDISEPAIQQARRAVYPESALGELGQARVERFFERLSDGFKIRKELRDLCVISRHDITNNPPFAKLDLISCRNVLIYFGPVLQKRIVPIFHYALRPGGFLWLGLSETPGASSSLFSLVDKQHKIYTKLPAPTAYLHLATSRFTTGNIDFPKLGPRENRIAEAQKSADQLVLSRYGPPGAVINHALEVLQFRGRTSPYLEPPPGQPSVSLLKMAHPELLSVLRQLVQTVRKQNAPVRKERVPVSKDGERRELNLEVLPLNPHAPERERQYLLVFEEASARDGSPKRTPAHRETSRSAARPDTRDGHLEQLLQEIDALREYQQTLIEQFESSQEELTSANEELQATNEELQSTNEELETAKEELQSANEELTTMNDELQSRNAELVAVNEKLARGEDRFRLMVESVKDYAIYMLDPEGRIASWNEGARRLKGYEAAEILGESYERFFPPELIAKGAPQEELERARIEGRFETEGWRLRKDGSRFWANVVVSRMNDSQGALIGFAKVTRDLTERKRVDEELARSERRFRQMISGVRDYAIFMLDSEARVASWNEGARRLKGYEEKEILGRHFSIFFPPEDVAAGKVERELEHAMTHGSVENEGWRVRKDGSRFWANVVITRVNDEHGNLLGFTKVTRDLTEKKKAEEALKRANETLEQRVKQRTEELERALKIRDEFLSIASHELKTPLTALGLQLEGVQKAVERGGDLSRISQKLEVGVRQFDRLGSLVEALLNVSRLSTSKLQLQLEQFDLGELVRDVVERLAGVAERAGSELVVAIEATHADGVWDRSRLDQVLMNLLTNSIKYGAGKRIDVALRDSEDSMELSVHDRGIGISSDDQERIFGRFERAVSPAHYGGLGLGLYIARQIVEAHRGTIDVQSLPGKGATFIVRLPRITRVAGAD